LAILHCPFEWLSHCCCCSSCCCDPCGGGGYGYAGYGYGGGGCCDPCGSYPAYYSQCMGGPCSGGCCDGGCGGGGCGGGGCSSGGCSSGGCGYQNYSPGVPSLGNPTPVPNPAEPPAAYLGQPLTYLPAQVTPF
jgi:hypothetical protein